MHWASKIRAHFCQRFVLLALAMGLVACGAPTSTIPTPETLVYPTPFPKTAQTITPDVRTRWLAGQPCAPPCWEGITPGKTRVDEAVALLNRHPMVTHIEIYRPLLGGDGRVSWRWNGVDAGSGLIGFPQVDPQDAHDVQDATNPIVSWVDVGFSHPFSLAEIRAAYGDPSHVVPLAARAGLTDGQSGSMSYYEFTVVYLDHGFLLQTERELYDPLVLGPHMALSNSVVFFPPTMAGLEAIPVSKRG